MRYVIEGIPDHMVEFFQDLDLREGDVIDAPEGFPKYYGQEDAAAVTLTRTIHPNLALLLDMSMEDGSIRLRPMTQGKVSRPIDAQTTDEAIFRLIEDVKDA